MHINLQCSIMDKVSKKNTGNYILFLYNHLYKKQGST